MDGWMNGWREAYVDVPRYFVFFSSLFCYWSKRDISHFMSCRIHSHSLNCWDLKLVYGGSTKYIYVCVCMCVLFGFTV